MSTGYEPNIEGAIAVLVDIMVANAFTMTRQPYEANYRGLVDAIIDFTFGCDLTHSIIPRTISVIYPLFWNSS